MPHPPVETITTAPAYCAATREGERIATLEDAQRALFKRGLEINRLVSYYEIGRAYCSLGLQGSRLCAANDSGGSFAEALALAIDDYDTGRGK